MACRCCSFALRQRRERWPRYPLARSSTTLRFLWALTARFTRAMCSTPLRRAGSLAQQLLHRLQVGRGQRHLVGQTAGSGAWLVLKVVLAVGPAADDLAGASQPEPLLGPAVRLHLRHVAASLVSGVLGARVPVPAAATSRAGALIRPRRLPHELRWYQLWPGFTAAGLGLAALGAVGLGAAGRGAAVRGGAGLGGACGGADEELPPAG